jgi:hypothetical protein
MGHPSVGFVWVRLLLAGLVLTPAVWRAVDESTGKGWLALVIGVVLGIAAGSAWWFWTRRQGVRDLGTRTRSWAFAVGLVAVAVLRTALPEEGLYMFLAFVGGLISVTAFPPIEA